MNSIRKLRGSPAQRETDLAQSCHQTSDLTKQLDQPFGHEEKLVAATNRQQEIIAGLDLTKNQAFAKLTDGVE